MRDEPPNDRPSGGSTRERWLVDVLSTGIGAPLSDGAIVTTRETIAIEPQILFVGSAKDAATLHPEAIPRRIGVAAAPRPANAHLHLDLSDLPLQSGGYEAFVRAVVQHGRAGRRGREAARRGLAALRTAGTRVIGDVVTDEAVMHELLQAPDLRGVAYWEVIGPDPADAERILSETVRKLGAFRARERAGGMRVGLSPHAPHTVSAPLLSGLARLASAHRLPLQIHAAESASETRLHQRGDGPLRELMGPLLTGWRPSGRTPIGYLHELGVLAAAPAIVHAVHASEEDLALLSQNGCALVHCPRSNERLSQGRFPWAAVARHGLRVAFGTDSTASSPSLNVKEEVTAARALHGEAAPWSALVRAAVQGGHALLRTEPERLAVGMPTSALAVWPHEPSPAGAA